MSSVEPIKPVRSGDTLRFTAPAAGKGERLARFRTAGAQRSGARDFLLPLEQLEGHGLEEWWLDGGAEPRTAGDGVQAVAAGDLLLCEAVEQPARDPRRAARRLYERLFAFLTANDYPHLVKGWNYLSDINEGSGDAERYKQFCLGRGEVLDARWTEDYLPAGTGVGGGSGTGLRVTLLASRVRPEIIENPRQVSAFRYPRQYGPKSPSFSRAAVIGDAKHRLLFISGTAAIVGHDSLHATSIEGQVQETLRNWASLFEAVERQTGTRPALSEDGWYRVYLRRPEHLVTARRELREAGLPLHRTLFLRADICRSELLFEMDGAIAVNA